MVRSGRRRAATGWSGGALAVVLVATAPAGQIGGIFSFGDARFYGSMGGQPLVAPVVGMGP